MRKAVFKLLMAHPSSGSSLSTISRVLIPSRTCLPVPSYFSFVLLELLAIVIIGIGAGVKGAERTKSALESPEVGAN